MGENMPRGKAQNIISAEVYMIFEGRRIPMGRKRIYIYPTKRDEGIIVRDGRPVKFVNGEWIYYAI